MKPHDAKRILCVLPDLDGGGAQRTMVNLVNSFPACGIDPTLVVLRGGGPAMAWVKDPARVLDLGVARSREGLGRLRQVIREHRPDGVFSTMVDANILSVLAARGLAPVVVRETNSHRARGDLGFLRRFLVRYTYRRAARVVALSTGVADELIADYGLPSASVQTIGNPVDVVGLQERIAEARTRPSPFTKPKSLNVIAVGRLTRQKGFDVLIEAFASCGSAIAQSATLHILGDGPDRAALEAQIQDLGLGERVSLPGFQADLSPWLAHADVFVLSSRWEGFGHVLVEAQAAGLPVLSTRAPHGPADILQDGINGLLVSPDSKGDLAVGLDEILCKAELRRALSDDGLQSCQRFDQKVIAQAYARLLQEAF